jgi:hypothetical protein
MTATYNIDRTRTVQFPYCTWYGTYNFYIFSHLRENFNTNPKCHQSAAQRLLREKTPTVRTVSPAFRTLRNSSVALVQSSTGLMSRV